MRQLAPWVKCGTPLVRGKGLLLCEASKGLIYSQKGAGARKSLKSYRFVLFISKTLSPFCQINYTFLRFAQKTSN